MLHFGVVPVIIPLDLFIYHVLFWLFIVFFLSQFFIINLLEFKDIVLSKLFHVYLFSISYQFIF